MSNKKVLIISSYAPPSVSGASVMMYNLFKYFPKNSFLFLTSHSNIDNWCIQNGNKLDAKYFYFDTPTLTTAPKGEGSNFQKIKRIFKKNIILKYIGQRLIFFYLAANAVRYGKKVIEEENVDIILAYSDHGLSFLSAYILSKICKKPLCLYFYDIYYGNNFSFFYRCIAMILEPKIFREAKMIFVMDEAVKDYYGKKYGKAITVIRNSIPIIKEEEKEIINNNSSKIKIVFTGSIYWAQVDAVKNIIKAIEDITDFDVSLWIYSTYNKKILNDQGIFEQSKVIFARGAPHEMAGIQSRADILFVPLTFKKKFSLLINTSSPGKTYEYMTSNRPILVHAPQGSYISKYTKENGCAMVVDEDDVEKLKNGILELLRNKDLSKKIIHNAWVTVRRNHDAEKNSKIFQDYLNSVI